MKITHFVCKAYKDITHKKLLNMESRTQINVICYNACVCLQPLSPVWTQDSQTGRGMIRQGRPKWIHWRMLEKGHWPSCNQFHKIYIMAFPQKIYWVNYSHLLECTCMVRIYAILPLNAGGFRNKISFENNCYFKLKRFHYN